MNTNVTFVPSTSTAGQMLQTGVAIVEIAGGRYARHHATRNTAEVGASGPCKLGARIGRTTYGSFNEAARA